MKRGGNILFFALGLWSAHAWADPSINLPQPPKAQPTGVTEAAPASGAEPRTSGSTTDALKREAYYHFFLDDYLTSATRLKLLEETVHTDTDTLNHVRLLRGSLYVAWGMHRPATVIFDQLVSAFPSGQDRNQVLLLIERLQYSRALYQAAVSTFERLTPDPAFASMDHAAYLAGMSHYALGNFERALDVMTAIPGSSDYRPFAQLTSAKSHTQLANVDEASRMLEELGGLQPEDDALLQALAEKSRLTLGLLFTETGRYDEALPAFASITQTSPFYPDAVFGAGWVHLYQQRYAESLAAFLTLLRAAPNHPYALEALTTIGHCYDRMGARGEAFHAYGKALDTYRRERQALDTMRGLIKDRDRLSGLLTDMTAVLDSPIGPLLDDDGLRFWVRQYGELGTIEQYLARKLADSDVFQVMVDHREAVFRDRVPTVRGFLTQNPVTPLRQREHQLQAALDQAVQHETAEAWALGSDPSVLSQLALARGQSRAVGETIARLRPSGQSDRLQIEDLKAQWNNADRWLSMLQGERLWTILTEVPGRRDDLQRAIIQVQIDLEQADHDQRALVDSINGLDTKLSQFRQRIQAIRQDLVAYRGELIDLRAELLPPLQALLLKAVDQRSGQMEAMAAVARLSQVHIMDVLTQ
ncbi:MAG: tetratricopeptide repeat protein [Nitrospirota bacterium]